MLSRRRFLQLGALGLGFGAITPYRLLADAARPSSDTNVIFLWLPGGPPHMETYDMKPDAPKEYRGDFKPIRTSVPRPRRVRASAAARPQRPAASALSAASTTPSATTAADTRSSSPGATRPSPPASSTTIPWSAPWSPSSATAPARCPDYVLGANPGRIGIDTYSFGSAYLGPSVHPFAVPGDPSSPKFQVRNLDAAPERQARLGDRLALLAGLEGEVPGLPASAENAAVLRRRALRLMGSEKTRAAFDLSREPAKLRERYGMHAWGQRCLLARRLVEGRQAAS